MKIVLANAYTKGKRLDADMADRIDGKGLSTRHSVLVRKLSSLKQHRLGKKPMVRRLDTSRGDLTPEEAADAALITEHVPGPEVCVRVRDSQSLSGDVIYSPLTQSTQYIARSAVKSNLERRIPGSVIRVLDIGGDGLVRLNLSISYEVDGEHIDLEALSLASPSDMTIISAQIHCGSKSYDIDPVDQSRTPEETAVFLKRLAGNCAFSA